MLIIKSEHWFIHFPTFSITFSFSIKTEKVCLEVHWKSFILLKCLFFCTLYLRIFNTSGHALWYMTITYISTFGTTEWYIYCTIAAFALYSGQFLQTNIELNERYLVDHLQKYLVKNDRRICIIYLNHP